MKTLKSQLQLLIISFSVIAMLLMLAGFIHNKRKDAIRNITYQLSEIENLVYKDIELINSFLLFELIDESFYITKRSENLNNHKQLYVKSKAIKNKIKDIELLDLKPKIEQLYTKMEILNLKIADLEKLQLERGFKDYGLVGSMRKDIHWIENNNSLPKYQMLMLRRHEKDYIIRQQVKYADKHQKLIAKLLKAKKNKGEVCKYLTSYHKKFLKLVELDTKIGKKGDQGLILDIKSSYSEISLLLNEIIDSGQRKQNEMLESYKYGYFSFALVFIIGSIFLGFYVSHRISRNIHKLSVGISEFVSSNFKSIPHLSHKGDKSEIHKLTKNFLVLRDEILDYIKSFEKKVEEQTETLSVQKQEIEEKNEKILLQKQELVEQLRINVQQKEKVTAQKKRLLESIEYAKNIQNALLPSSTKINSIYKNNFVLYQPKDIISGDFYWFKRIETGSINLSISIVADCTGHGVPGALLSMLGITYLNDIIINKGEYRPDIVLNILREKFIETLQQMDNQFIVNDGLDIGICIIDNTTDILYYAGANRSLYLIRNSKLFIIKGNKMPIGKHQNDTVPFKGLKIKIKPHDNIYLFTDGFADQFGGVNGRKFMRKRFRSLLLSIQNESFEDQKRIMNRHFKQWKGNHCQVDDVLVVGFEYKKDISISKSSSRVFGVPLNFEKSSLS